MSTLRTLLLVSTLIPLAACGGADDVASPGEGVIIVPTPAPTPTPTPGGGTPTPTPGGPFTGATPAGFVDRGVVGNRRVFEMPARFTQDTTLQNIPGAVYQIAGPVNVGTDVGGDGNASGGQRVTLTIQPGTIIIASAGNDYLVVNRGSRPQCGRHAHPADHLYRPGEPARHRDRFDPGLVGRDHPVGPRADLGLQRPGPRRLRPVPERDRRHDRLALWRQRSDRQ
jgi:hypothetical protein